MALTRALADPTLGATSGGWFIYDDKESTVIEKTSKSAAALAAEGFELDHVFERQFLSGLIVHVMGAQDPPMSTINDLLHIANLPENLVWIRKDLHDLKSSVFGELDLAPDLKPSKCAHNIANQVGQWQSLMRGSALISLSVNLCLDLLWTNFQPPVKS
ncbi:hypothetical protein Asppvi_005502 [Aspergillus pseudoviridinutans]|uniref:Uncharacterized protein n=1 Tax=Aspergillus pseudoviridinutans TaxID=1517512 RepID=A0A9P3B8B9_9EURO|nr:uncharacterized protein Asppvi_005502 [Aspergillus pseudoviridinutans]GIJ86612.1 hypothetical protein Asppvi_005502 [Aspergillus pseudoviridinutans]